ncbi:MAG: hypothetical protein ABI778_04945 [Ignavibacteriota bacterium]
MKKIFLLILFLLLSVPGFAQNLSDKAQPASDPSQKYQGIGGGIGASIFQGKPFLLLNAATQFELWQTLGVGIDGYVRIGSDGKFRKEDFDDWYDALRWIGYIRVGHPGEDLYARLGGLNNISLGHGTIVDNYSNNSSYDNRKIGLIGRVDMGLFGGDAFTSDVLVNKGIIAGRGFVRPFQAVPVLGTSWFFKNVELGATASYDLDPNAVRIVPNHYPFDTLYHVLRGDDKTLRDSIVILRDSANIPSPLTVYGVDATVMVWQSENLEGRVYGDYVDIIHFNNGFVFGARASFLVDSTTFVDLRLERYLFKNHFLPNYYNSFYERERFNDDIDTLSYITKATRLSDTSSGQGNGFKFGSFFNFNNKVQLGLTYAHLDNVRGGDLLQISLTFPQIWWKFFGAINYIRSNIDRPKDYFGFDEHTLASARLSFQPFKFLTLNLLARWTFTRDDNDHVATQYILEPKAVFIARF